MPTPFTPTNALLIDDFETFIQYLERKPNLVLTGNADLKSVDLWALNERVNYKAPSYVTPRSRQADYPLLGFLLQLATASRLFVIAFGKANTLVPNATRLDAYRNLTQEEKYVFLLETAWCYLDWAVLDGDGRSGQGADWFRMGVQQLVQHPVGTKLTLSKDWETRHNPGTIQVSSMANIFVRAGHWFGWYTIQEAGQLKRDKYNLEIDRVALTEWGQACLSVLLRERPFQYWNKNAGEYIFFETEGDDEPDPEPVDVNTFALPFRILLEEPDLLSLYPINPNPPTGTFWFRVDLPNHQASRTIAVPAILTLDDLHTMIQDGFKFANDHLYNFYLNWRNPYNGECYSSPVDDWSEHPSADTVTLAQLNLYEGQRLLYVFDLADRWNFFITVVRHLPDDKSDKARVVEKTGKAPAQYGSW